MQLPRHPACWRRLAGQRRQDTIEWAAVLLVVAALIAAVVSFAPQLGSTLGHDVQCVIAKISGGGCTVGAPGKTVSVSSRTARYIGRASAGMSAGGGAYGARTADRRFASSPPRAVAAITGPSVNQIIHGLGLDVLGKAAVAAAERTASQNAAGSGTFSGILKALGTYVSKDRVAGLLVSFGFDVGDLSCEQGPLYMRAQPTFALVANVLGLVSRAQAGSNRPLGSGAFCRATSRGPGRRGAGLALSFEATAGTGRWRRSSSP